MRLEEARIENSVFSIQYSELSKCKYLDRRIAIVRAKEAAFVHNARQMSVQVCRRWKGKILSSDTLSKMIMTRLLM